DLRFLRKTCLLPAPAGLRFYYSAVIENAPATFSALSFLLLLFFTVSSSQISHISTVYTPTKLL
uniref:Uncharacterized protein n=1 Tax=Oryza brachyantha TaxID=4533 RepID=J3MV11_ORYBR